MADGDNRIRLDEVPVDFTRTDIIDQLHSEYPSPNSQARYDQMRSYLIGLLSNQSSVEEPFEKRVGTFWFNKQTMLMMLFSGADFDAFAKFISVETTDEDNPINNLQQVLDDMSSLLAFVGPKVVWSGVFTNDEVDSIPVPTEYQDYSVMSGMQAFVYVNGLLIDPRRTVIDKQTPQQINLIGVNVKPNQTFTVKLEKITSIKEETVPAEG